MFRKLFGIKSSLPDLTRWNKIGRKVATNDCAELEAFHLGKTEEPKLSQDARTPEMAEAVLQEVIAFNREGRGNEARAKFDPAHTPFVTELEKGGRGLTCCAVLGPKDYLVQQGATYQDNTTWRIEGEKIYEIPGISTFSWSRNRRHFATVYQDGGLSVGSHFDDANADQIPPIPGSAFVPKNLPDDCASKFSNPGDNQTYSRISVSDMEQSCFYVTSNEGFCCS